MRTESPIAMQLQGYRLATAEILYRLPDHPTLLQTYIWQDYDIAPRYPVLNRFLSFWAREIEGKLFSVRVTGKELISAGEIRIGTLFQIQ